MTYEGYDKALMNVADIMHQRKPHVDTYNHDQGLVEQQMCAEGMWMELVDALCAAAPPYMHEHFLNVCHTGKLTVT